MPPKPASEVTKEDKSPPAQRALSVRQPWAWLIVNGYKDIENRVWSTKVRERILIHAAAKSVTQDDYDEFLEVCRERRIKNPPDRKGFDLGGIVGSAEIVDCVEASRSYWFNGPYGFVLKGARTTPFKPLKGMLGLFRVE
ncbi:MAG: ASCH domain-containing protein [Planctomycetota bacterium]|nr:ASCH domain-containing protein [Planctomycetota bacterium]